MSPEPLRSQSDSEFLDKLLLLTRKAVAANDEAETAKQHHRELCEQICELIGGDRLAAISNAQRAIGRMMTGARR